MKSGTDLMLLVRRAETLIGDFVLEADEVLNEARETDAEVFDCFDEIHTALGAMAGAFRYHRGTPDKSNLYLALSKYGSWCLVNWSEKFGKWNSRDEDETDEYGFEDGVIVAYFDLPDAKEYVNVGDD